MTSFLRLSSASLGAEHELVQSIFTFLSLTGSVCVRRGVKKT